MCTILAVLVNLKKMLKDIAHSNSKEEHTEKTQKYARALEYEMFEVRVKWFLDSDAVKITIYIYEPAKKMYFELFPPDSGEYKQVS